MLRKSLQHGAKEIAAKGSDRNWWRNRFRERILRPYFERTHSSPDPKIPDADWDNLLLLDACRYDLFEATAEDLPGTLSKRISHASATPGYLSTNFSEKSFHEIVYVTSNPFVNTELPKDTFHDVINVWENGWDDDLGTVPPEAMLTAIREAYSQYNDKRIMGHFCQPHYPFIGEIQMGDCSISSIRNRAGGYTEDQISNKEITPFDLLKEGEVTRNEVWEAYQSNLERVLPTIKILLHELEGRTVVTADHGNALGEFALPFPIRIYGHPRGIRVSPTVQVPWLVHENGSRRTINSSPPTQQSLDTDATDERLQALGYKT